MHEKMIRNAFFITLLLSFQSTIFICGDGVYSIIGPGTIRSHCQYSVAVCLHKADAPSKIEVAISGPSYNESKILDIEEFSIQKVDFEVPQLASGDYYLKVAGLAGTIFANSSKLNYEDFKPLIFMQTSKATYKPSDLVQYRILILDENTRPANITQPIAITIYDGAKNRIKQINNVELTNGVFSGELQLSEQPVLGNWNIGVSIEGGSSETKTFEVAKYVLPKFEVIVDTAKDVALQDGIIKVTVRAKYTYGKMVTGKAIVSLTPSYSYLRANALIQNKTTDIYGKAHVEFNFDPSELQQLYSNLPINIDAIVEEELTGKQQNATATVMLHINSYKLEGIDSPTTFYAGKQFTYQIAVKHVDGSPVLNSKNNVTLYFQPQPSFGFMSSYYNRANPTALSVQEIVSQASLNEQGIAKFNITLQESSSKFFQVRCTFRNTTAYLPSISKFEKDKNIQDMLKISIKTKKPQLGKYVIFEVMSSEPLPYFIYIVVARGNIVKMEYVDVPDDQSAHTIKFKPTFEMIPKATIYVHYIFNKSLRHEEQAINFEKGFNNTIEITVPAQVKPSEEVTIHVQTDPGSFVGLLGVDQSVLLLKGGNDLNRDDVFNKLNAFETNTPFLRGYGRYPGVTSGVVTLTNAHYPYNTAILNDDDISIENLMDYDEVDSLNRFKESFEATQPPRQKQKHQIRSNFNDIWIWQELEKLSTDKDGLTLTKNIPDTITSWIITGFSVNTESGLALVENPSKIQVFQPFFLATNLPYSVKRGEVIAIPIIISNYMEKAVDAQVTLDNSDGEFEFAEATNEIDENIIGDVKRTKSVAVPSNTGKGVSFMIRPKSVGDVTLKITAVTPLAGDGLQQKLRVDPEGVTKYGNKAIFVQLKNETEFKGVMRADIPADAVKDSEYIELSAVGDILGPVMSNLGNLVRMPYGCGEQNMVNFVPNILVLKYLEVTNQKLPSISEKAKKYLESGYQRELTYKHDDGSYSAFGKSDNAGSTWLTAYVIRSFHQAANFIDIDTKIVMEGLDFLASKQAENGRFAEVGKLVDFGNKSDLVLTAFVLLAFYENNEHIVKYQGYVDKATAYVADEIEKTDDQYSLAIAAKALQLAKHPKLDTVLTKLENAAKIVGNKKWWSAGHNNDVEITSYVLLALLDNKADENVVPIVKWLISQRNSNGGFVSTQDTVVGLQALTKFAQNTGVGNGDINIEFATHNANATEGSIKINKDNSLVTHTNVLPRSTRQVDIRVTGNSSGLVQLSYRYNVVDDEKIPAFNIVPTVKDNSMKLLTLDICTEFVATNNADNITANNSNMAVMEVTLPSGYTSEVESFDKIKMIDSVKQVEASNADSTIVVYFESLAPGDVKCVPIEASKSHAVAKLKPASIVMYDYYDTQRRATKHYQVNSSLCDICEGEDCGKGCQN